MLCMKCKKKEAAFYYKQTVNGKVNETALCADCASKLQVSDDIDIDIDFNPFAELFGGLSTAQRRRSDTRRRCTLCGLTFSDLVRSGKVGCAKCYEVFADELAPTVNQLHGKAEHNGRAPGHFAAKNEKKNKLKKLKAELRCAIESQDFEQAAVLRDRIKEIEE